MIKCKAVFTVFYDKYSMSLGIKCHWLSKKRYLFCGCFIDINKPRLAKDQKVWICLEYAKVNDACEVLRRWAERWGNLPPYVKGHVWMHVLQLAILRFRHARMQKPWSSKSWLFYKMISNYIFQIHRDIKYILGHLHISFFIFSRSVSF